MGFPLVFLALVLMGLGQCAEAQTMTRSTIFDGWEVLRSGNSTRIVPAGFGVPAVTVPAGSGTTAGSFSVSQVGRTVQVAGSASVPGIGTSGKLVPVVAKSLVSPKNVMRAVSMFAGSYGGPLLLTAGLAAYAEYVNSTDKYRVNPETGNTEELVSTGVCPFRSSAGHTPSYEGNDKVTSRWEMRSGPPAVAAGYCVWGWAYYSGYYGWNPLFSGVTAGIKLDEETEWFPRSMDDISPYMDTPEAPLFTPANFIKTAQAAGITPFQSGPNPGDKVLGQPSLTGPASVPGKKTEKTTSTTVKEGTTTEAPPGYAGATEKGTKTETTTSTTNITYAGDKITNTTTNITNITITNNVTNVTSPPETDTEETIEDEPEEDNPTDTPLGDMPKLYERKYPEGLKGVWDENIEAIKATPLFTLADSLMPTGLSGGSCPSWSVNLSFPGGFGDYGEQSVSPPCWVWDVARTIVIVSALILARALIFGG